MGNTKNEPHLSLRKKQELGCLLAHLVTGQFMVYFMPDGSKFVHSPDFRAPAHCSTECAGKQTYFQSSYDIYDLFLLVALRNLPNSSGTCLRNYPAFLAE